MSTCREVRDGEEPPLLVRIGWSVLVVHHRYRSAGAGWVEADSDRDYRRRMPLAGFVSIMVTLCFIKRRQSALERQVILISELIKRLKDGFQLK